MKVVWFKFQKQIWVFYCFIGVGEVVTRGKNKDGKFCMISILLIIMKNRWKLYFSIICILYMSLWGSKVIMISLKHLTVDSPNCGILGPFLILEFCYWYEEIVGMFLKIFLKQTLGRNPSECPDALYYSIYIIISASMYVKINLPMGY